jgi:hypothetical protein
MKLSESRKLLPFPFETMHRDIGLRGKPVRDSVRIRTTKSLCAEGEEDGLNRVFVQAETVLSSAGGAVRNERKPVQRIPRTATGRARLVKENLTGPEYDRAREGTELTRTEGNTIL